MKRIYQFMAAAFSLVLIGTESKAQFCNAGFTVSVSGNTVTTTNTSTGGVGPVYQWSWGDSSGPQYAFSPSHTYIQPGNYVICLSMWDSAGCQSYSCDTISISQTSSLQENKLSAAGLAVYPNPAGETAGLVFTLTKPAEVTLVIYDVSGKLIRESQPEQMSSGRHQVNQDLSGLGAGIYIAEIKAGESIDRTRFAKLQ